MEIDMIFINSLKAYREEYHQSRKEFVAKQFLSGLFRQFEAKKIEEYPDYIFYVVNNQTFVEYNTKDKYFCYSYYKIYSVLKSEFGLNEQKINDLIQGMVDEHLKLGVVTPFKSLSVVLCAWWMSI